jgi:hypothetical protein
MLIAHPGCSRRNKSDFRKKLLLPELVVPSVQGQKVRWDDPEAGGDRQSRDRSQGRRGPAILRKRHTELLWQLLFFGRPGLKVMTS